KWSSARGTAVCRRAIYGERGGCQVAVFREGRIDCGTFFPTGGDAVSEVVQIFADESCLGNQYKDRNRPGGAGGLLAYKHATRGWVFRDFWTSEVDTTNNRMAIRSALIPLSALKRPSHVIFTSDSRYLVDAMSRWVHDWVRRGWKRKDGEIENVHLWQELLPVAQKHRVEWRWVRGHAGH